MQVPPPPIDTRERIDLPMAGLAILAIAIPVLIAFNRSPSATFFNQAAAYVGWGALLTLVASRISDRGRQPRSAGCVAMLAALAILVAAALLASLIVGAPWPLSLSAAGTIVAAMLVVHVGSRTARAGESASRGAFTAVCIALVVAGVASSAIGLIQVYAPNLAESNWIAPPSSPGRATGNVRQPNHLSSLLLWSVVAATWLGERRPVWRPALWLLSLLFVEVIVLTASRTGLIGMFMLVGWGLLDRRLSRATRLVLVCSPLAYLALWGGATWIAQATAQPFEGAQRMSGSRLYVSTRYAIWANSLSLIAMHPWLGVGFGEFNFAWTLTPFPNRPTEFFDHAHNLPLHFVVELGIPLALVVLALLGYALSVALRHAIADGRAAGAVVTRLWARGEAATRPSMQRAAFVMVVMVVVHSMLEYPLWYSYFLLPAAFTFGLCLERPQPDPDFAVRAAPAARPLVLASMLLVLGGTLAVWDYLRVVVIFDPPAGVKSLEERIAEGRWSVLFGHHADYAAATIADRPGQAIEAFRRSTHFLLDTRLMVAWARALQETGEIDKARHLAARLKEFRNSDAHEYLAPCDPANVAAAGLASPPARCLPPQRRYRFEDFR